MKEKILKLRNEGKTYKQIAKELTCAVSTISYHCGEGQKKKNQLRNLRNAVKRNEGVRNKRSWVQLFVQRYKQFVGCFDCGNKDYRVLDCDHRDRSTKLYNIGNIVIWSYSISFVKEELRKCDIRCANCHRIKTLGDKKF